MSAALQRVTLSMKQHLVICTGFGVMQPTEDEYHDPFDHSW
jgi:hypothetical protein